MIACCYILANVAKHMRKQINDLEHVSDMVQTLDRMFVESSSIVRQIAIRVVMNTCMTRGNVRDHCLKMMGHISTAEVMGNLNVVKAGLVENYNDKWIIDSGATNHACYSLEWFKQSRPLSKRQKSLKLGNGEYVSVMAVGRVELCF